MRKLTNGLLALGLLIAVGFTTVNAQEVPAQEIMPGVGGDAPFRELPEALRDVRRQIPVQGGDVRIRQGNGRRIRVRIISRNAADREFLNALSAILSFCPKSQFRSPV